MKKGPKSNWENHRPGANLSGNRTYLDTYRGDHCTGLRDRQVRISTVMRLTGLLENLTRPVLLRNS